MIAEWRGKGVRPDHGGDLEKMSAVDDVDKLIEHYHLVLPQGRRNPRQPLLPARARVG